MRTGADEAAQPKYAHVERERRWLVDAARRPPLGGTASVLIEDRYIHGTRCRLRCMTDGEATSRKLTKKYDGDPLARPIVTAYLTEDEHAVFAALPATPLMKRRHAIFHDGREWSLDRFEGALAGLELIEIEAPDAETLAALVPPAWAVREVSGDSRYQGGTLAIHGIPEN